MTNTHREETQDGTDPSLNDLQPSQGSSYAINLSLGDFSFFFRPGLKLFYTGTLGTALVLALPGIQRAID